jgi:hypothetical protein
MGENISPCKPPRRINCMCEICGGVNTLVIVKCFACWRKFGFFLSYWGDFALKSFILTSSIFVSLFSVVIVTISAHLSAENSLKSIVHDEIFLSYLTLISAGENSLMIVHVPLAKKDHEFVSNCGESWDHPMPTAARILIHTAVARRSYCQNCTALRTGVWPAAQR